MQGSFYKPEFGSRAVEEQSLQVVLHPDHMDDLILWRAFRAGDEKALITIFGRFSRPMYNYGYKIASDRELVKDAIQELFIDIWQNRERFEENLLRFIGTRAAVEN